MFRGLVLGVSFGTSVLKLPVFGQHQHSPNLHHPQIKRKHMTPTLDSDITAWNLCTMTMVNRFVAYFDGHPEGWLDVMDMSSGHGIGSYFHGRPEILPYVPWSKSWRLVEVGLLGAFLLFAGAVARGRGSKPLWLGSRYYVRDVEMTQPIKWGVEKQQQQQQQQQQQHRRNATTPSKRDHHKDHTIYKMIAIVFRFPLALYTGF